jgi:hypothetical protein
MGKVILAYWINVIVKAAKAMWDNLGIWGLLFGLAVSGFYTIVIGEQTFSLKGISIFIVVLVALMVAAWVPFILKVAAVQDQNKERAINDLSAKLKNVEGSKPVIYASNSSVQPKFVNQVWNNAISVDVLNTSPGTTAEKVLPTVTWYTLRGKLVTENHGRWWISNLDMTVTKTADRQVMDLLSNGRVYLFHFAIRPPEEKLFYAWCREDNGSDGRFPLPDKKYRVKIQFKSNNAAEANFFYVVTNDDENLSIEEITK